MAPPSRRVKIAVFVTYEMEFNSADLINKSEMLELLQLYSSTAAYLQQSSVLYSRENHIRMQNFYETWISHYLNYDFFQLFRMGRSTFYKLLSVVGNTKLKHFSPEVHSGGLEEVPLEKSLMIFLWYVGKAETFISIGDRFNVAVSTVYSIITKCLTYFLKLVRNYIKWPLYDERVTVEEEFRKLAGFPGVIGAIDGCHIPIKCEIKQQDSYTNRKFFKSINLQAVCTTSKLLTNIYVGFPGSAHDSRWQLVTFETSQLASQLWDPNQILCITHPDYCY